MAFSVVEDLYGSLEMIVFPKTFSVYAGLLNSGTIILVEGKISVKDDEVKLIAEKISLAPESAENIQSSVEAGRQSDEPKIQSSSKKKGVFLRISSKVSGESEKIKNLVSIFEGSMPVYVYFEDTAKYEFLGKDFLTSINEPLVRELKYILGADNVVIRE